MNPNDQQRIIDTLSNCEDIKDAQAHYNEISQFKQQFENNPKKKQLDLFFTTIGNSDRILILDALREKDRCVCELEAILGKSQPSVSHQIKMLEKVNLIRGWKKGKFTHYSLVEKTFNEFLLLIKEWSTDISNWFGKV